MRGDAPAPVIRACQPDDAPAICEIYNHYVRESAATFEEQSVPERAMRARIREARAILPWLVWQDSAGIAGFAFAALWKSRPGYRFTVESTVYVAPGKIRRGIGSRLYAALLEDLKGRGIHCVVATIALPNDPSIALHEKFGFVKSGHLEEIGFKFRRWTDVGLWALMISKPANPSPADPSA